MNIPIEDLKSSFSAFKKITALLEPLSQESRERVIEAVRIIIAPIKKQSTEEQP